jgi:hypothetical protein
LFEVFNVRKLGDFVVPSRRVFSLVLPPKEYFHVMLALALFDHVLSNLGGVASLGLTQRTKNLTKIRMHGLTLLWLKRAMRTLHPHLFPGLLQPCQLAAVVTRRRRRTKMKRLATILMT